MDTFHKEVHYSYTGLSIPAYDFEEEEMQIRASITVS
jgi:hypothetical protein